MSEKNLEALFLHNLKDNYFAEQQIAKAMPALIKAAESQELRSAFETHSRKRRSSSDVSRRCSTSWARSRKALPAKGFSEF